MKTFALALALCSFAGIVTAQVGAETAFSKSYSFEYDSEYAKAIAALLELKSESYQKDLRLGWLYYLSKDYQRSEQFYKKAVQQESYSVEARFGLALPLSALGNYTAVLETYQEILRIDPNNSIANYRSASIYYSRKDLTNAGVAISKVIRMYPFDYDSNLLYGKILLAQGKSGEARKHIEKSMQYNPQSEEARHLLKQIK